MVKNLRFLFYLLGTSIKASASLRGAFLLEMSLMLANNLVFFSVWYIFFQQFNSVGGWHLQDMVVMIIVGTGGYGFMRVCCGGIRDLSKKILSGDLDPFMTQPKPLLMHVAASRSWARGWGHILTSLLLIIGSRITDPLILTLLIISILCVFAIFSSCAIIAHSLAFWLGPIENLSERYTDSLFLFALYPTNIYSGMMEIVMFTLIPAGLIGFLPVEIIRQFSWPMFFALLGSAAFFVSLAIFIFYSGLKQYESGNQFGVR